MLWVRVRHIYTEGGKKERSHQNPSGMDHWIIDGEGDQISRLFNTQEVNVSADTLEKHQPMDGST